MVEPADLRSRDHLTAVWRLHGASIWAVFVERQMGARAVIVIDVRDQDPAQMPLVKDHYVIQAYMDPASAQGCLSMLRIGCSHISGLLLG